MRYAAIQRRLPGPLRRHILHFESAIEQAVSRFSRELPPNSRVLDAGAGEGQYRHFFNGHRYVGIDLAVGDPTWDYQSGLDVRGDLSHMPFADSTFDAAINIVTLEHLSDPRSALCELQRTLAPGGKLLLIAPQDWEVHQAPYDFYRYTRYGLRHLLESAGFHEVRVYPIGGFFRLLSRRLWNSLQFFHGIGWLLWLIAIAVPALLLPYFDNIDRYKDFTLGYRCLARKP